MKRVNAANVRVSSRPLWPLLVLSSAQPSVRHTDLQLFKHPWQTEQRQRRRPSCNLVVRFPRGVPPSHLVHCYWLESTHPPSKGGHPESPECSKKNKKIKAEGRRYIHCHTLLYESMDWFVGKFCVVYLKHRQPLLQEVWLRWNLANKAWWIRGMAIRLCYVKPVLIMKLDTNSGKGSYMSGGERAYCVSVVGYEWICCVFVIANQ